MRSARDDLDCMSVVLLASASAVLSLLARDPGERTEKAKLETRKVFGMGSFRLVGDDELSEALASNEVWVSEALDGKRVALLGTVDGVSFASKGYTVVFRVGATPVYCEAPSSERPRVARLVRKHSIIVLGVFHRRRRDLVIERCRVSYGFDEEPIVAAKSAEICAAQLTGPGEAAESLAGRARAALGSRRRIPCTEPIIITVLVCEEWKAGVEEGILRSSCNRAGVMDILNELIVGEGGETRKASGNPFIAEPPQSSALYKSVFGDKPRQ
jgi:hypothetical protein